MQLAGNHEMHHLGGHQFQATCEVPDEAVDLMREWLDEGWMRMAVTVEAAGREALVTHAG